MQNEEGDGGVDLDSTDEEDGSASPSDGSEDCSASPSDGSGGTDCPPAARGVLNPPEPGSSNWSATISSYAPIDEAQGLLYWDSTDSYGRSSIWRGQLGATVTIERVYEGATRLEVLAVGPEAVYFVDEETGQVGRLSHDLEALDLGWGSVKLKVGYYGTGIVSAEHLYFSESFRVHLSGGEAEPSPFGRPIGRGCALSPDRTIGACSNGIVYLASDTETDELTWNNGDHAADEEAFYFTPQVSVGEVMRVPYDTLIPTFLASVGEVDTAAAAPGRLYLGVDGGILTLDSATGDVLSETAVDKEPNSALYVFGDHVYYGIAGGTLQRIASSALE